MNEIPEDLNASWALMNVAATRGLREMGYDISRIPGRGRSNMWHAEKAGVTMTVSVRTTRDRWIAFPPLEGGTRWKTLDDADAVLVATVDEKEDPSSIDVYLLNAEDVRKRFDAAYAARIEAGNQVADNFGMWVGLDHDDRGLPASVGSGLTKDLEPFASYAISDLADKQDTRAHEDLESVSGDSVTIAELMREAKAAIATIAGVSQEAVRLELKIEMI
ncbi:hypothetical protein A3753_30575 [Sulfitobacter sp. HI0082]|uniref:hypothetical protein n=1 Tax=unclassified Sulfitobacter TaxID=196795 RepID=UPI0007CFD062|nr:hypothetical protein A3753_30575 [Sulfitobacter sp. HI0082]|tara:strand:- start:61 stop:717 length:657 start_codon:yes stop_codon:yes gene_type:complete